jgi:hypothetical protein
MSQEDEEFDRLNSTVNFARSSEKSPNRDNVTLELILHRLEALEANIHAKSSESSSTLRHSAQSCFASAHSTPDQATGSLGSEHLAAENSAFSDLQEKYNSIRSSFDKVILPTHLKLHDSRTGIKREDQPVLNVLSRCGRYVETVIKLLSQVEEGKQLDLDPIATVLAANIEYLQDEYSALLVKGRFDSNTANLFRALTKGNSGFTERNINNVRVAAELSSIHNRYSAPVRPQFARGFTRGYSFGYSGATGSGGFSRGGYRGRFDGFGGSRSRFPTNFARGRAPQQSQDSIDEQ